MYHKQDALQNREEFQISTKADHAEAFAEQWDERVLRPFPWAYEKLKVWGGNCGN
jgi:hypothetical protein